MKLNKLIEKLTELSNKKNDNIDVVFYNDFFDEFIDIDDIIYIKGLNTSRDKPVIMIKGKDFKFSNSKLRVYENKAKDKS